MRRRTRKNKKPVTKNKPKKSKGKKDMSQGIRSMTEESDPDTGMSVWDEPIDPDL